MEKPLLPIAPTDDVIMNRIYQIRETKVMLDRDLAELYGVETSQLKSQVKRKIDRFPGDFMFELTIEEFLIWRLQFDHSQEGHKMGRRYAPYAFTEQGIGMLSSVFNKDPVIHANIQILRNFNKMRKMELPDKEILCKLKQLENQVNYQDQQIQNIFEYHKQFLFPHKMKKKAAQKKVIGKPKVVGDQESVFMRF